MEPLQGVENGIARKNYVPSSFKNSCPGVRTLNHIESEPVKVFVMSVLCGRNVNEAIKSRDK